MTAAALAVAMLVLSIERATYVAIARAPDAFRAWCARSAAQRFGPPIAIVEKLFYVFKAAQLAVFIGWCLVIGGGLWPTSRTLSAIMVAVALMVGGQVLNVSAFYRLGRVGAFFFLMMRFPAGDWYLLPVVETVYYALGAVLEERGPRSP